MVDTKRVRKSGYTLNRRHDTTHEWSPSCRPDPPDNRTPNKVMSFQV